jgi:uncharacterized DUF497 family protein
VEFEWDDAKAKSNHVKHGVSFDYAKLVFDDPHLIDRPDETVNYDEERTIATGMVQGRMIVVVFTMRDGRCRLISARKATRNEQQDYYNQA